jgi:hypothetical protein
MIGLERFCVQDLTALTHFSGKKGVKQDHAFRTADRHDQTAMDQVNLSGLSHLNPNIARAFGPSPHIAAFLPGYGDEPKISNRGPIGLGIAINDNDAFSAPCRR